jgi:hypothetical protein
MTNKVQLEVRVSQKKDKAAIIITDNHMNMVWECQEDAIYTLISALQKVASELWPQKQEVQSSETD